MTKCPRNCTCTFDLQTRLVTVNCANTKLTQVPVIPSDANILLLNDNQLTTIKTDQFYNLRNLTTLDLSKNTIQTLQPNSFRGLSKLQILVLTYNQLQLRMCVPLNIFQPLEQLSHLYVAGNCAYVEAGLSLLKEIATVSTLEFLQISGYSDLVFPDSFKNLKFLSEVKFDGDYFCKINTITNRTFVNLSASIRILSLTDCHIKEVQRGSFASLNRLETLHFSSNREICHDGWRNLTTGLRYTAIKTLNIEHNCLHVYPDNHTLGYNDLQPLSETKLQVLNIKHCELQVIEPDVIARALPITLETLFLKDNDLNSPYFIIYLPRLSFLQYLDISSQARYNLNGVSGAIKVNYGTKKKHIQRLGRLGDDCPPDTYHIPLPQRLKFINASNLNLEYAVPKLEFRFNNSVETFDVSKCLLWWICGKISGLHKLKNLDLSRNRIRYIAHDAFSDMPSLEDLNLSENQFGDIFNDDASVLIFQNLTNLTRLDLSSNKIKRFPSFIFSKLRRLEVLNVRDNAVETIQFGIESFVQSLRALDLSNNNIKYLPAMITDGLDSIRNMSTFELSIQGNKLMCNCMDLPFVNWISNTKILIADYRNITCKAPNETDIELPRLRLIAGQMSLSCFTWAVLTACVSFFIASLIVLGLATVSYRQRWKLRYLYYSSLKRVNPFILTEEQTESTFDVYLSFDQDHVLEDNTKLYDVISVKVIQALHERGLTAKIREDLSAGKSLHSLISSAIQQCNKIIIFLSRDYCKDFWNTFEFNMAAYDGMYTHRRVILPVLVEDIASGDLLPEVKIYMNKEVVIKFDSERFDEFIEQLFHAISV